MHIAKFLRSRGVSGRRGQALVELTIILPVLLVILLGGIDLGRIFFSWVNLQNAARIAADYAAVNTAGPFTAGSAYRTIVTRDTVGINCLNLTFQDPVFSPNTNVGSTASVTISCDFRLLLPIGGPIPMSATSVFAIRGGTIANVPGGGAPPCDPPNWIVISYSGFTYSAAKASWEAAGGTFLTNVTNGNKNWIVTSQTVDATRCATPGLGLKVDNK